MALSSSTPHIPGLVEAALHLLSRGCTLTPAQRLVLLALAKHGGPHSKGLYPSVRCLAGETGFCERTVQTHLHELEHLGVVRIHRRAHASNLYELCLDQAHASGTDATERSTQPQENTLTTALTFEEMRAVMAFVAEAGTDATLELDPKLLCPSETPAPTTPQAALSASAPAVLPPAAVPLRSEARVQRLRPLPMAATPPSAPVAQRLLPRVQSLQEGGAAAAPELGSENLSKEQTKTSDAPARAPVPAWREQLAAYADATPTPAEVEALWTETCAGRGVGAPVAEPDSSLFAMLTQTARSKARTRQQALRARGEPPAALGVLAREYLAHIFSACLAEMEPPPHESLDVAYWKKHPLSGIEQDLLRLGEPWASRQQAARTPKPPTTAVRQPHNTPTRGAEASHASAQPQAMMAHAALLRLQPSAQRLATAQPRGVSEPDRVAAALAAAEAKEPPRHNAHRSKLSPPRKAG